MNVVSARGLMRGSTHWRKPTAILQLPLEERDHSLRVTFVLLIAFDYLAKLGNPLVERIEITLVVHPGFVHVVQNLLHNPFASVLYHRT
jgi:hypothetical protein